MTELESLRQAFDEMKAIAAQRLEALKEAERQRDELLAALLKVARMAEKLKRPCSMDPESKQAIRNGEYMNISYAAHAAIAAARKEG